MIFTHLARLLAIMAVVLGLYRILLGLALAIGVVSPYEVALAGFTTASSSGQVIDGGIYIILFAMALGTLAEISFSLRKRAT